MDLSTIVRSFDELKFLVVGDVMVDSYLWGKSDRISPEAPVPVVDIQGKEDRLGGAANVALNLSQLGARVFLASVCGNDPLKNMLFNLLEEHSISPEYIVRDESRVTTQKTRVISQGKHLIRFDHENTVDISKETEEDVVSGIKAIISREKIDGVVIQDYNKGLLTQDLIKSLLSIADLHGIPVSVDPKKKQFFSYKGVELFKPNLAEVKNALGSEIDPVNTESLARACEELTRKLECSNIIITLSDKGIFYYDKNGHSDRIPAHLRNIIDVSGAGDTVISVATASLTIDQNLYKAAVLSNLAGGLVCEKVGVVHISQSELLNALKQDSFEFETKQFGV